MGQRHQAFLIARIVPHNATGAKPLYRCVAAIHHQWCYGILPVRAANRFIKLSKQKTNAKIIREELRSLDGLYGRWKEEPLIPDVPCPYTTSLFRSAWGCDAEDYTEPYTSNVIVLEAGMGSSQGDNNDGITIIDVTDPEHPAYCFVDLGRMSPMAAERYVGGYYPLEADEDRGPEFDKNLRDYISLLNDVPLITITMLAEAWPREYKAHTKSKSKTDEGVTNDQNLPNKEAGIPSLASLTFKPAFLNAIETGQLELLDHLVEVPEHIEEAKALLRGQDFLSENAVSLVAKLVLRGYESSSVLDLSSFSLTTKDIVGTVAQSNEIIDTLDLSYNTLVTVDTLEKVLAIHPSLRRIVVFNTNVDSQELTQLLREKPSLFYHLEALVHPIFLQSQK